ncbi:MAG: TolC family protein [Armatimonadetes bacterium]|nr:TolC family protein [Armatimonadota bacterium]
MAYESLRQSEYNLYNKTQDVLIEIINAYYEVLKNIQLVKAKKSDFMRLEKTLEQIKDYFKVGLKAKIDFTTASVNLSQAKLELIKAENDLKVSYQNLYKAMGIKEDITFNLIEIKETEKYAPSLAQALEKGFKERRDLKILESQIKSALIEINYNQRGTYPALNANGSYSWNGQNYPLPYTWNIGLNFNWIFFDRGLTNWKIKEAEENVNDLKSQLESKKNELKKEIAAYYSEIMKYFESIQINQEKLVLAAENLELAEERYKVGVGNIVELTNAQSEYIKTEANSVNSLYDYLKAKASLEKSTGVDLASIYIKN